MSDPGPPASGSPAGAGPQGGPGRGDSGHPDERDRDPGDLEEERERYQELLQELRVILPGVEVLAGFLFTVPFANGFSRLDEAGKVGFALSLLSATAATVAFLTPTAFHRVAERADRADRIRLGVAMTLIGMAFLAIALNAAMFVVTRSIYGTVVGAILTGGLALGMLAAWVVLPARYRPRR